MLNIISNGSKWMGEPPDPIESLFEALQKYPLDRSLFRDRYFSLSFVTPNQIRVLGNFMGASHVFNMETDEPQIIEALVHGIEENTKREDYLSQIDLVTLWWIGDDIDEVNQWNRELDGVSGRIIYTYPDDLTQQQHVLLNMPREAAKSRYNYSDTSLAENDIGVDFSYVKTHVLRGLR